MSKNFLRVAVCCVVMFGFVHIAGASSLSSGFETAEFSNTNYGSLKFVVSGSDLETAGGTAVSITSSQMTGDGWGNHVGWVRLNGNGTAEHSVTVSCASGIATLSGYGFGENTGWINFGPFTGDAAAYQPIINSSGNFSGAVWTENFGWLDVSDLKTTASPCATTSSGSGSGGGGSISGGGVLVVTKPVDILGSGTCPANLIVHDFMKMNDRNGKYSAYNKKIVTEVAILQAHINRILASQYTQASGPTDGLFGKLTKQGVMRLQSVLNQVLKPQPALKVDGIVGSFTRAAINNSCGVIK